MGSNAEGVTVRNDRTSNQFEARVQGQLAVLVYQQSSAQLTVLHTEVPASLRGQGIGDALARAALDYARDQHLTVVPVCPFVAAYIQRHPEYQSLLASA